MTEVLNPRTDWPSLTLDPVGLADLELVAIGAVPRPETMTFSVATAGLEAGTDVALRDAEGVMIAGLRITDVTSTRVRGTVDDVRRPHHPDYPELRLTPSQLLERLKGTDPAGVWMDGLPSVADVALIDGLAAAGRQVVVFVPVGGEDPHDAHFHLRIRCVRAVVAEPIVIALVPVLPARTDAATTIARAYGVDGVATAAGDGEVPAAVADELARVRPPRDRQGFTVLFSGLSGSGKSTVAGLLAVRLLERGDRHVTVLDGDVVRLRLSKGLGFSREDRDENVRRIGFVAAEVTAAGGITVCAPIAPYDATRREVRTMVERGGGFVLVHVATPLEVCEARDRKGLYAKARAGLLPGFTGISDPYEPPADAEVVIDTSTLTTEESVAVVLDALAALGWLPDVD